MILDEWRRRVRIAVGSADAADIVAAVSAQLPEECLQAAGSALLVALAAGADGARALASRCVSRLQERSWDGDAELVAELECALAGSAGSPLRPVPVDLEDLADVLAAGLGDDPAVLDLETGEVWPAVAIEYALENEDAGGPPEPDGVRALEVDPEGSAEPYRDMEAYISLVSDPVLADRLSRAIAGKGAFRRFRDAIDAWSDETTRWHAYSDDRRIGRARSWLADAGFRPVPRRPGN